MLSHLPVEGRAGTAGAAAFHGGVQQDGIAMAVDRPGHV